MNQNTLEVVKEQLLLPTGLEERQLERVLNQVLSHTVDYADIYLESSQVESWMLEDGIVKEAHLSSDRGVGVRAICGDKTGYAYSDDLILPSLEHAAKAARSIAQQGGRHAVSVFTQQNSIARYAMENPLMAMSDADKVQLLQHLDQFTRQKDPRVERVAVSLYNEYGVVFVLTSNGRLAADIRPMVRLDVSVVVQEKGRREKGHAGWGGRFSLSRLDDQNCLQTAEEAVRQALVNLAAIPAPAGTMPVVLGPGWPGVLLHEAVGHGLEADFNRKGSSAFAGLIGQAVASPLCTVVDDGTLQHHRGSLSIDDEGMPTQRTVLIEKGILKQYMQDTMNARLMKMAPTGNGRRESYAHMPMPRMTNTFMLAGESDPAEIIASIQKGIYAVNFAGGQVDITSGKFVFSTSEAYLIENGKITHPIKGATLIGSGPDVMRKISMVGNDLALDKGVGVCGKDGQSVPVCVGQPTLKINELTVGGTQYDDSE